MRFSFQICVIKVSRMETCMEFDIKNYEKMCKMITALTDINVEILDANCSSLLKYGPLGLPSFLDREIKRTFSKIINYIFSSNKMIKYKNSFGINYFGTKLKNDVSTFLIVGPYLTDNPSSEFISKVIYSNKFPVTIREQIKNFYQSISIINNAKEKLIIDLVSYMSENPLQKSYQNEIDSLIENPDLEESLMISNRELNAELITEIIEKRYFVENEIMHAVEIGDKNKLFEIIREFGFLFMLNERVPYDPLRGGKNISFTLNTLLRKAAEKGGLHPVYVHSISEKFAIKIEKVKNSHELSELYNEMFAEYCDQVLKFSTQRYSRLIKKAIDFININLQRNFTLNELADEIYTNPSHLSRQFKKETNETITDFINRKRISEAKRILLSSDRQITDIANMLGYNDINYFTKVFKKFTGTTPSAFKKK